MQANNTNRVSALFFLAAFVVLMTGMAIIPAAIQQQQAQAANPNSESRNKGESGEISSDCKRVGNDKKTVTECTEPPPPVEEFVFCYPSSTDLNGQVYGCLTTMEDCLAGQEIDDFASGPCQEFAEPPPNYRECSFGEFAYGCVIPQ